MDFGKFHFGRIEIDDVTYERDVVIDRGRLRKRKKKTSRHLRPLLREGHRGFALRRKIRRNRPSSPAAPILWCPQNRAKPRIRGNFGYPSGESTTFRTGWRREVNSNRQLPISKLPDDSIMLEFATARRTALIARNYNTVSPCKGFHVRGEFRPRRAVKPKAELAAAAHIVNAAGATNKCFARRVRRNRSISSGSARGFRDSTMFAKARD
jgi:hypothetical protein